MGVILEMAPVVTVNGGTTDLSEVNEKIEALEQEVRLLKEEITKVDIEYIVK